MYINIVSDFAMILSEKYAQNKIWDKVTPRIWPQI